MLTDSPMSDGLLSLCPYFSGSLHSIAPIICCLTNSFSLVPTLVRSYCCCLLSYPLMHTA